MTDVKQCWEAIIPFRVTHAFEKDKHVCLTITSRTTRTLSRSSPVLAAAVGWTRSGEAGAANERPAIDLNLV